MEPSFPKRDAELRFLEAAQHYDGAFEALRNALEQTDLGAIPAWVFAFDRLTMEEIREISTELEQTERYRRQWRVALHALAELIALEPDDESEPLDDEETPTRGTDGADADPANLARLDRFIATVNYAKAGGCVYINGTFQPVARPGPTVPRDDKQTYDPAPARDPDEAPPSE